MKRKGLAAAAAAVVLLGLLIADERLQSRANTAMREQEAVYMTYQQLLTNAAEASVTVAEGGNPVGSYSLEQMGVLQAVQDAVSVQFWPQEKMKPEDFQKLSLWEKLEWYGVSHTEKPEVSLHDTPVQTACVWEDLNAVTRPAAKDAYPAFEDGVFLTVPEEAGTVLVEEPVEDVLVQTVSAMVLTADAPTAVTVELTDCACYVPPSVTSENAAFDYPDLLRQELEGKQLQLQFIDQTVALDEKALAQLLMVDETGAVSVREQPLRELIEGWSRTYDKTRTPFMFQSYVQGYVPISFLKVDYTLDQEALYRMLSAQLPKLDMTPVTAPVVCRKYKGDAFSLGDTYVEVDIENQIMTYFKDGELLVSTDVVTGLPDGHMTPRGLYYTYNKKPDCWLIGDDYCVFVEYWVGVYELYGLHDASWRSKFGGTLYKTNGSHGCVNTPTEPMKVIYDNIEVGTPTLIF